MTGAQHVVLGPVRRAGPAPLRGGVHDRDDAAPRSGDHRGDAQGVSSAADQDPRAVGRRRRNRHCLRSDHGPIMSHARWAPVVRVVHATPGRTRSRSGHGRCYRRFAVNESRDVPRRPDTWVVVPLYNEAAVIADVVRGIREVFPQVVCVDDGSKRRFRGRGPSGRRRRRAAPGEPRPGCRAADRHLLRAARPRDALRRHLRRRRPAPGRGRARHGGDPAHRRGRRRLRLPLPRLPHQAAAAPSAPCSGPPSSTRT